MNSNSYFFNICFEPVCLFNRKILAPGEEENLEFEEEEENGAGAAGSTEVLPSHSPGTARLLLPLNQVLLEGLCSVVCCELLLQGCFMCMFFGFFPLCWCCAWPSRSLLPQLPQVCVCCVGDRLNLCALVCRSAVGAFGTRCFWTV